MSEMKSDNLTGMLLAGKYKLLTELGYGGYYKSYLTMNEESNKVYIAIVYDISEKIEGTALRKAILRESGFVRELDHPMIPKIYDIVEEDPYLFVIREHIQGESLARTVNSRGRIPQEQIMSWAAELCDVLQYLHSQNPPFVYGILEPLNIILLPNGNLKLVGFDQVCDAYRHTDGRFTMPCLNPGYAAPEGYCGIMYQDARTDIYSLGVVMYYLATGLDPSIPPYEIRPIRQIDANLSWQLEYIIEKCTQLNPADRYQNCGELLRDIRCDYPDPKRPNFWSKLRNLKLSMEMNARHRKKK